MPKSSQNLLKQNNFVLQNPSFLKTVSAEIFSFSTITFTLFLALLYLFATDFLLNYRLITLSIANNFPLLSIISLITSLMLGSFTSMASEPLTLFVTYLNAILVGVNLVLLIKAIYWLKNQKGIHLSIGGATLFSLVTAGCASCGLSLLSILGLSASLAFLPFHGHELRFISLGLLILSAFYMLKRLHEEKYCKI